MIRAATRSTLTTCLIVAGLTLATTPPASNASPGHPQARPSAGTAVSAGNKPTVLKNSKPRRAFRLGKAQAQRYMRIGLSRKFGSLFTYGHNKRVKCRHRIRIGAIRCKTLRWAIGEFEFDGRGVIWITYRNGIAWWNYAFRVRQTSTYCVEQGLPKCSSVIVVR